MSMIRKLQKITSFGVFDEFSWPTGLHEFKQFNLLYGWNYSGKTTFSRAFRCFELVQRHVDFPAAEVHLHCEGGTIHTLSTTTGPHHYRVFNVDFVRDNLFFDEGSAEPILILGAMDIAKQQTLQTKQGDLGILQDDIQAAADERIGLENALDKALTKAARDYIKTPLNRVNYDKVKFQPKVVACEHDPAAHILSELDYKRELDTYNSTEKKADISVRTQAMVSTVSALSARLHSLTSRSAKGLTIEAVASDAELEQWVNRGRQLHQSKKDCLFCGATLPSGLLERLAQHFSNDYENLMADLDALEVSITNALHESPQLPPSASFYADLEPALGQQTSKLDALMSDRRSALSLLHEALCSKRKLAYTPMSVPAAADNGDEISTVLGQIAMLITTHNERSQQFDQNREKAFAKIEKHWASRFALDQDYAATLVKIKGLKQEEESKKSRKTALLTEINHLESEISEAVKGAETINDLLGAYFGRGDLRITVADNNRFNIMRSGLVAKNLSEGERSAVAFVHFMTRLLDEKHPLSDTTVIVDDPMCSLDANHLFNTYSFVKTKLSGCYQLFVLTHNYEFYSLIKEWALDDEKSRKDKAQSAWKHWSIYLIRRKDDGTSTVETIPLELLKFKSEYHYLFATLLRFQTQTGSDYDYLFSLPNVARRFMEAFGGVMIPTYEGLRSKLPRLISDEVQRERVWKFINDYSHNTSMNRSLLIPDVSECKEIVAACLKAVEDWDSDYFNDLKTAVQ